MPAANDIAEPTGAPPTRAPVASAPSRDGERPGEARPVTTARRGGGLTVAQAVLAAAGLLVATTLIVTAARSHDSAPDPSATADAVVTTSASTTVVVSSTAPTAAAQSAPTTAAQSTTVAATGAPTTQVPATPAPSTAASSQPTVATTASAPTTAARTPTTVAPTASTLPPVDGPPSQTLPGGQPWPTAVLGSDGRLVVQGAVPSAASRQALVATLAPIVGKDLVTDQLTVDATAAAVKYVPVRLGPAINFGPGDPDVTDAERKVLVLWGTFLRANASGQLQLVARGPKPFAQDQLNAATTRLVAAKRELVSSGADAKQIITIAAGDATVQNGRLDINLAVAA